MSATWQHYNSSKYAASCDYCKREIHTSEGRWVQPKPDGRGRWNACHNCIAPPDAGKSAAPPPLNGETPSVTPKIDSPACPQTPAAPAPQASETREQAIERCHAENVQWAKAQYDALKGIETALVSIKASMVERTSILKERAS